MNEFLIHVSLPGLSANRDHDGYYLIIKHIGQFRGWLALGVSSIVYVNCVKSLLSITIVAHIVLPLFLIDKRIQILDFSDRLL